MIDHREIDGRQIELAELAGLRAVCYRFLAALFLYPNEQRWANLRATAESLENTHDLLTAFPFCEQFESLIVAVKSISEQEVNSTAAEYFDLFIGGVDGARVPIYESHYLDPRGGQTGWLAAQLKQEYSAAGVPLTERPNELLDHAAVELEFLGMLCEREAEAWVEQVTEKSVRSLENQNAFLEQHISKWFPLFAERVQTLQQMGVYSSSAEAAMAFVSHDYHLTGLLLRRIRSDETAVASGDICKSQS